MPGKFYYFLNRVIALFLLIIAIPLIFVPISLILILTCNGSVLFKQIRLGHNKKPFLLYKFRTMKPNAEQSREKYIHLNYADGPAFKIRNDPRFTKIGKFLSDTHIDELPQLWNVAKGEMFLVGFRPPIKSEVENYKLRHFERFNGYPGITSIWASHGGHDSYSFDEWIEQDIKYESKRTLSYDLHLIFLSLISTVKRFYG